MTKNTKIEILAKSAARPAEVLGRVVGPRPPNQDLLALASEFDSDEWETIEDALAEHLNAPEGSVSVDADGDVHVAGRGWISRERVGRFVDSMVR